MTRVRDALAGKRFFITGATGFLGTALVERLLRTVPDCEVVLLIRPTRRSDPMQRATKEILKNDCFDRLRQETGDDFDARVTSRVTAVAGDVATDGLGLDDEGRRQLSHTDIVIHSAASVSFDAPLDAAVEVNLLGPSRVAEATVIARQAANQEGRTGPIHFIPVSTAYVAGTHQGEAKEELLEGNRYSLDVAWKGEVDAARRQRGDSEAESRRPERLHAFAKEARSELGGAGLHLLAERAERLREDWVKKQLVEIGKLRAQSLGWPDAYPYTKALGERALISQYGDMLPITIIRPSIIESALAEPRPGWIRGFRMAEPIIVSYARGLLKEFPGVAEGVTDVIPVDLVVATIIAVSGEALIDSDASNNPDANQYQGPSVYHVASGVRNPFNYGRLVKLIREWFTEHPLYDADGQPIMVPEWSFPGRGRVQQQLTRASKAMDLAERVVGSLPIRGRQAAWMAALEEKHLLADRALGYVELYGAYTETEARYRVDRLLALWDRMDEDDRQAYGLDPAMVDWDHYIREIHLPSIVEHARVRTTPGSRSSRPGSTGPARPSSPPTVTWPPSTSRTPSSPPMWSTPTPGWPLATSRPGNGWRSWPTWCGKRRPSSPSTGATGATSSGRSTGGTRTRRWPGSKTTAGSSSTTSCWPSRSRPPSPGCGSTGPSATAPSSSPGPSTSWSSRSARSSTRSSAPGSARPTAATPGDWPNFRHRRGPGPGVGRLRRGRGPRAGRVDGLRRLGQRPADAGSGGLPGGGEPGGQAGRHRPPARLAR